MALYTPIKYCMDVRKYGVLRVLWYGCITTDPLTSAGVLEREPLRLVVSFLLRISMEVNLFLLKKYQAHDEC